MKEYTIKRLITGSTLLLGILLLGTIPGSAQHQTKLPTLYKNLDFRSIGPAVTGGRIHDLEALPDDPSTLYVASATGGIWKSTNKGTTWEPIFDDQATSSFGDLAIAPSNPDIIWAGTGGQNNRQSTAWGNGVYRSVDGGDSWEHLGLEETRHIGRVKVHPQDPDVAYVAALGNLWKGSKERGVYKTTDGGQSWKKVLFIDQYTGTVDLAMHPTNPDILYAATYQRLRRTWGFNGGGPGSGIYKTTDGGNNWTELTNGIPNANKGRIGIAIARSNPDILYATIEFADDDSTGTYRTDDGGSSWKRINELNPRPMYYSHIFVDPNNADRVYVLATEFYMSENGGKQFRQMPTRPTYDIGVHSDHHTMWIDPTDTEHFYLAGDAGLHETWDRGETYIRMNNIPIGQFYAIGVDMRDPYFIYGGMQDNHSWMGPSETRRFMGIINGDWSQVGFGDGMYHQPDPTNYKYVYSGAQNGGFTRLDGETGDLLDIEPEPVAEDEEYRFDWVSPIVISQHDPTTVYAGGNRLFISHDRGNSWKRTEDLTTDTDREELELMGVKGKNINISKNDGTASYGEITTIGESPLTPEVLWVGTDDGTLQVSRDAGESWTERSGHIDGLPQGTYVSRVIGSRTGKGAAYATFDAHRDGDFRPYAYRTEDYGRSWTNITDGLPDEGSVNVIVEHPDNPNLLFLGTEHELFASIDRGNNWLKFGANLPTTLYDDLVIHPRENDLVAGTHGRSLWIFDDLTPLVEWSNQIEHNKAHLFSIQPAILFQYWKSTSYMGQAAYTGENPPQGAILNYYLAEPRDTVTFTVRNSEDKVVRQFGAASEGGTLHRTTWDLRHPAPPFPEDDAEEPSDDQDVVESETILPQPPHTLETQGAFVSPGVYTVTMTAGDQRISRPVTVKADPKMPLTDDQWHKREEFLVDVLDMQRKVFDNAEKVANWKSQIDTLKKGFSEDGIPSDLQEQSAIVDSLAKRIGAASTFSGLRGDIYQLSGPFNRGGVSQGSLYPPTDKHYRQKKQAEEKLRILIRDISQEESKTERIIEMYGAVE